MAPAPSEAPAFATEGQARSANQNASEFGVIGGFDFSSRRQNSEGARREVLAPVYAHGAERVRR
jgi:hypothetical protein